MAVFGIFPRTSEPREITVARAALKGASPGPEFDLFCQIIQHKSMTDGDAAQRKALYDRFDALYYPSAITSGGPDHWPNDPHLSEAGKVHISLNTAPPYVEIPAHMQAITPYINAVADSPEEDDVEAADAREKLFWSLWYDRQMDEMLENACRLRSLYGDLALHPYWDSNDKMPAVRVIEQPSLLRIGWGASDFSRKDWALLMYAMSPQAIREEWNLTVTTENVGGEPVQIVGQASHSDPLGQKFDTFSRTPSQYEQTQVTVYDYWYKKEGAIWHAVYVANHQAANEARPEYKDIPFVWIPNGRVPGSPNGRSDLHDIEQLIREKEQRLSEIGQVFHRAVQGPMWQLTGQETPGEVPAEAIPAPNTIALPGPGNRLEPITPWLPTFDGNQYLERLDRELQFRSGISDLLAGIAGANYGGSSKAINAELAMYAPRIGFPRDQLYVGIHELWAMIGRLWEHKDPNIKKVLKGNYRIVIEPPELTVRDDVETSAMAVNLVDRKIWSRRRAMDKTGVDNPSEELAAILSEQTNAALEPAAVMQMIQLIMAANSAGVAAPTAQQAAQPTLRDQALAELGQRQAAAAKAGANTPPQGSQAANTPGVPPSPENAPSNTGGAALTSQTMLANGEASGRILSQQQIGG